MSKEILFDELDVDTKAEIEAEIWNIIFTTPSEYVMDTFKRYIDELKETSKREFAIFVYSKTIGEIFGANDPDLIFNSMNAKYVAFYIGGVEILKEFLKKVYKDTTLLQEIDDVMDKIPKQSEQKYFF